MGGKLGLACATPGSSSSLQWLLVSNLCSFNLKQTKFSGCPPQAIPLPAGLCSPLFPKDEDESKQGDFCLLSLYGSKKGLFEAGHAWLQVQAKLDQLLSVQG